ncbi:MAG: hypothetical protein HY954_08575 [Deltaproteobacteria bacterium]|nr:hypothetical protein [Deltaproteobacteria bacterium]
MENPDYLSSGLEIVESYEKRSKVIIELINEAAGLVDEHSSEQDAILVTLKETLAKTERLRKKDFDRLVESVLGRREEMKARLKESLDALWAEEAEMVRRLTDIFTKGKPEDFEFINNAHIPRMREREEVVVKLLMGLHIGQAELSVELRRLLSKGADLKIRDFKSAIKELKALQDEKGADNAVEELERLRLDILGQWRGVCSAYERSSHQA